jgi:hypothetical protein
MGVPMRKPIMVILSLLILSSYPKADIFETRRIERPNIIMEYSDPDSLVALLNCSDESVKVAACKRLGEIGEKRNLNDLYSAFQKEIYRDGIDLPYGIKYYAPISMANIGGRDAEEMIKGIASGHLIKTRRVDLFSTRDTIAALSGSFFALSKIASISAHAYLDSVFEDRQAYWFIRSLANLNAIRIELAKDSLATKADTAQLLMSRLDSLGGPHRQFDDKGEINDVFIKAHNIRLLIYEFRGWITPFLNDYIDSLSQNDPKLPSILQLQTNIERNP